jgi:hypothetical protein
MKLQFIEPDLDHFAGKFRRPAIRGKQSHLATVSFVALKNINGFTPGCVLVVIDFAEIKHLPLDNTVVGCALILDNAPVSMFFAVFESAFGSEKHKAIVPNNKRKSRG